MAQRTYVPHLLFLLNVVVKYMKRYQNKLQGTLTVQQYQCLVATIEAADLCLQAIPEPPINN
jgi:hypothetical protein